MKTDATVYAFFIAMALYPEVQKKAHAELGTLYSKTRSR